jgi:hypothetical protein
LGQGDVAPEWQQGKTEVSAITVPAEKTWPKAYREAVGDEAALLSSNKVTEFVYEDGEAKRKER